MKALSIHPLWAQAILCGLKTIEVRTWRTEYRGDLLICSTAKKMKDTIPGHALCVVRLADVVELKKKHLKAALMEPADYEEGLFAWILEDVRPIKPIPLKGKLSLWNYDGEIEYLPIYPQDSPEDQALFDEIYKPLLV